MRKMMRLPFDGGSPAAGRGRRTIQKIGMHCRMLPLLVLLTLTGCGGQREELLQLKNYTEEMQTFCSTAAACQERMDAVDAAAEDAGEQILQAVDEMAAAAVLAAQAEVPDGYESAGEFCRRASDYLQEARGEYHAAFDGDTVDQTALGEGNADYQSAGRCISLMLEAFQTE